MRGLRLLLIAIVSAAPSAARAAEAPVTAERLLGLVDAARERIDEAARRGLIEIAPVHLPVDPPGDCNHYGWPIATLAGDALIVMHRRIPGHNPRGAGRPHEKMSYGVVLRSTDAGRTWSEPYDLRDCARPEDRVRGGTVPLSHRFKFDPGNTSTEGWKIHLHALGTLRDGAVVALGNHGAFRSDDAGRTWRHLREAFRDDIFPHPIVNLGPNLIDLGEQGLLAFGNWFGTAKGPAWHEQLVVLRSRDGGAHWDAEPHAVGFRQYEPAALRFEDRVLFVTRDQTSGREHRQMTWIPGQAPTAAKTNLVDPKYVDTTDLSYNPVTKRFEVVRSERYRMELWLWSLAPADWETGRWRRECRLLAREGQFYATSDGFHPAGAVVDARRGLQHVFVYAGLPQGPAGVFRITRTLDTPKLAEVLSPASP